VTIHGYARVSTADQNPDAQLEALRRAGAERIFVERRSGKSRNGRRELAALLASIRRGDVLVVTKLDRIGRSLRDLANIAHEIESAGAHLRVLDQNVDTSTSAGRAFFGMIATFAQFELDIRAERQRAGIEAAKKRGTHLGPLPSIDYEKVRNLNASGMPATAIAAELGTSRASIYRILGRLTTRAPSRSAKPDSSTNTSRHDETVSCRSCVADTKPA
jgi:DNA invertase Pin-like site-specific DNA recombinase